MDELTWSLAGPCPMMASRQTKLLLFVQTIEWLVIELKGALAKKILQEYENYNGTVGYKNIGIYMLLDQTQGA